MKSIVAYEHEALKVDDVRLTTDQFKALQAHYGVHGVPYFTLLHNGVKFNEYVGVIQVGATTIEVLPKADRETNDDKWRAMLVSMLRQTGSIDVRSTGTSSLSLKSNSILDLYFEIFLNEVEGLLHRGLVKRYRSVEANCKALKGSILFPKHLRKNLIHKELFYVRQNQYDVNHKLHQVLRKALELIKSINTNTMLSGKVSTLLLWFPQTDDLKVSASLFERIKLDRKTEPYRNALQIAKLLLLNFHPDLSRGRNHVLALMFDMNLLWERFVCTCLRREFQKTRPAYRVHSQTKKNFWRADAGNVARIKPDIVVDVDGGKCVVLDTKWKNLKGQRPADDDLKQLFVYHKYYGARKVALVYPGELALSGGKYYDYGGVEGQEECGMLGIKVQKDIRSWQTTLGNAIGDWISREKR